MIKSYNICGTPVVQRLPGRFSRDCEEGRGSLHDVLDFTISMFPDVAFAHIQPKGDVVQRFLYSTISLSFKKAPNLLCSATKLNRAANEIFEKHNAHPNYIVYLIDGHWHTFA